jgi:endonuclease-3
MNEAAIRDRLVDHGHLLFQAPAAFVKFTGVHDADVLLNDLGQRPHAFVLACIMDRQIKAERAWVIPYRISEKLDDFTIATLGKLSLGDIKKLMGKPKPLHRMFDRMSGFFHSGVQRIITHYRGDAARIWRGQPPSAEVIYRFLEFERIGPKIATMATNILARDLKIPFADYVSIDISADVHVRRVFGRLGLCAFDASIEKIIYKARALHSEFPGMMDLACWEIGRKWCKPSNPDCSGCFMSDLCPTPQRKLRQFST